MTRADFQSLGTWAVGNEVLIINATGLATKKYGIRILKDIYNKIKKLIKDIKLTLAKARDTSLFV